MNQILIVDDEKNIRIGLQVMIEREYPDKYQIRLAVDGEEGLELYEQLPADIIITDIRMPVLDGLEMMKRIAAMEQTDTMPQTIILSGYDDFEYAKTAIQFKVQDYLLKPVRREELFKAMDKIELALEIKRRKVVQETEYAVYREELRTSLLQQLLLVSEPISKDLEEMSKLIGFEQYPEHYHIGVLMCVDDEGHKMDRKNMAHLMERLTEAIPQLIEMAMEDQDGRIVIMVHNEAIFHQIARQSAEMGVSSLLIGVSDSVTGIGQYREAYLQALAALSYTFIMPQHTVIPYSLIQDKMVYPLSPHEEFRKLYNMLGTDREKEMKLQLKQLFKLDQLANMDIHYLQLTSKQMNEFVLDTVFHQYGEASVEVIKLYRKVGDMSNFRYFHQYYRNLEWLLMNLNDYVKQVQSVHSDHDGIKKAIAYIEANYHRPLNMAVVSNHVSLNYSYFSEMFKAYTGENFVFYLKKVRIQHAKELIKADKGKFFEIGEAVGFENAKQFTRVFKEIEGISPQEYRAKIQCTPYEKLP